MATDESEKNILEHASNRYMEAGVSKVSMDEIASELQVSKKTIYKFFPSKQALLKGVVNLFTRRVQAQVKKIVNSDAPFEQKMVDLLLVLGKMLGKMSKQFVLDVQRSSPALWKEIETFRDEQILSQLKAMFVQAKKEGIFRDEINTDLFYMMFISSVDGIINPTTLTEQSFSAKEAFQGILELLIDGALTPDAREKYHFFSEI
ncbi:MAG: TetR/AcrR family transcriptional regulator [Balneolaceae bacterium]